MPTKIPATKGRETSVTQRKRRKRKPRKRSPYLDQDGRPTKRFQHLVWCANFHEIFVDRDPLRQAVDRWIDQWNAEMLEELAKITLDCRRGFENLTIKDRATVYAIRAIRELCVDPRFDDSAKPSITMLKAKTLELMARGASLLPGETVAEQRKRLESKVRWPTLLGNLPVTDFVRTLGRPVNVSSKTPGDTVPTIFSWDMREFKSPPENPLALGLMNQVPPGGG
jgi:hypothetical protein